MSRGLVLLFDVDNTLLDNDRVAADLHALPRDGGRRRARSERYWATLRAAARRARLRRLPRRAPALPHRVPARPAPADGLAFLVNYPVREPPLPRIARRARARARQWGATVILSDGDVVFQPRKIERSGLFEAVGGNVLIYVHKEQELDDVAARYPAEHYVLVDDKLRILDAVKQVWGARVTTVFPRQGHYAHDPEALARYPPPDVTIERIGNFLSLDAHSLRHAASRGDTRTT